MYSFVQNLMSEVIFRTATCDDIELINKLAWEIFPETYKSILTKEQNDYMMDMMYSYANLKKQMTELGHTYCIAYLGQQPVGYASVRPQEKDIFHLEKIYVHPNFQNHKIGRKLFLHAIELIKQMHPEKCIMELNVNRNNKARGFYEHMGMKIVRQGDFPIGNGYYMNDYIMQMEI